MSRGGHPSHLPLEFDEGIYLFQSLQLAEHHATLFHKGPLLYVLAAGALRLAPSLLAARMVGLLCDVLLIGAVYGVVRRLGPRAAFAAALLVAVSPLSCYFAFHLLTDVPLALCVFLTVADFSRARNAGGIARACLWTILAFAVKPAAYFLLPTLVVVGLLQKKPAGHIATAVAVPALAAAALSALWPHAPSHDLALALTNSFGCGVLYYGFIAVLTLSPFVVYALVEALRARAWVGCSLQAGMAAALAMFAFLFTAFGDPQPKYAVTFVPLAAALVGPWLAARRARTWLVVVALTALWSVPLGRMMEADRTVSTVAGYLAQLPQPVVYTTIPPGTGHEDALAGPVRFLAGKLLEYMPAAQLVAQAQRTVGGIVVWTDSYGAPDDLEATLRAEGLPYRRLNYAPGTATPRPLFLVNTRGLPDPPPTVLPPNMLQAPFLTPLDDLWARVRGRLLHPGL